MEYNVKDMGTFEVHTKAMEAFIKGLDAMQQAGNKKVNIDWLKLQMSYLEANIIAELTDMPGWKESKWEDVKGSE